MTSESPRKPGRAGSPGGDFPAHIEVRDDEIRVVVAVAIQREGRVLVIREEDEPDHHAWVFPQGYPKPGEGLAEAARREAFEELGLDVELDGLLGVYEGFSEPGVEPRIHRVTICYRAHPVQNATPRASREAIDSAWIDPASIAPASMPSIRRPLEDLRASSPAAGRRPRRPSGTARRAVTP